MMPYPFIVEIIPLQYRHNNRIASCCNYRNENFQYRPTLLDDQLMMLITSGLGLGLLTLTLTLRK